MASSNFQIPSPHLYIRLCNSDDFQSVKIALKGYNEAKHLSCFRLVWRKEVFIRKFYFRFFTFLQRIRILIKIFFGNIRYLIIGLLDMTLHYFSNTNSNVFLCVCDVTIKWILMSLSDELQHKMSFCKRCHF